MRLLLNTLVALALVAVLGGVVYNSRTEQDRANARTFAQEETRRFQQQVHLQAALLLSKTGERGYPQMIEPAWFQGNLPRNPLLPTSHPWLEIAGPEDVARRHPVRRTADDQTVATFWYNPANGLVRARVSAEITDEKALHLYNYVNGSDLPTLFAREE
jgi:hypothetical protein